MQNFAPLYAETGRSEIAKELYLRAQTGLEEVLGSGCERCEKIRGAIESL